MSFRNFLCRQRRHEDGDHDQTRSEIKYIQWIHTFSAKNKVAEF